MSSALVSFVLALSVGQAEGTFNFKAVKPEVTESDKKQVPDIWVMDFTFRSPRYVMAEIPGKGRKLIWYMTYTVTNRSEKPRLFVPQFTLVSDSGKVYKDVIVPSAERAIIAREDPTRLISGNDDRKRFLNSVTISQLIPPSAKEGVPEKRHGIVCWEDVDMNDTLKFSIFATGLSNGYVVTQDPKSKKELTKRKTLRLDFIKPSDAFDPNEKEIRLSGDPTWVYR